MSRRKKSQKKESIFKNRIVGYFEKPAKDFRVNIKNFRIHSNLQTSALNEILVEIGWVTGVIESKHSGLLLDGHLRVAEALDQGEETLVPYLLVDLSEDEENKILALFDKIGSLAAVDNEKFAELVESLKFDSLVLNEVVDGMKTSEINLDDFFTEKPLENILSEKYSIALEFSSKEDYAHVLSGLQQIDAAPAVAVKILLEQRQ